MDDIVLGDVADVAAEAVVVGVKVEVVDEAAAGGGDEVAVEGHHEGGFTGTGWTHEADEFGGVGGKTYIIEDAAFFGGGAGVGDIDGDAFGAEFDVALVFFAEGPACGVEANHVRPKTYEVLGSYKARSGEAFAVEEGAVGAAEVFEEPAFGGAAEAGVVAADLGCDEDEVAGVVATDGEGVFSGGELDGFALAAGSGLEVGDARHGEAVGAEEEDVAVADEDGGILVDGDGAHINICAVGGAAVDNVPVFGVNTL